MKWRISQRNHALREVSGWKNSERSVPNPTLWPYPSLNQSLTTARLHRMPCLCVSLRRAPHRYNYQPSAWTWNCHCPIGRKGGDTLSQPTPITCKVIIEIPGFPEDGIDWSIGWCSRLANGECASSLPLSSTSISTTATSLSSSEDILQPIFTAQKGLGNCPYLYVALHRQPMLFKPQGRAKVLEAKCSQQLFRPRSCYPET